MFRRFPPATGTRRTVTSPGGQSGTHRDTSTPAPTHPATPTLSRVISVDQAVGIALASVVLICVPGPSVLFIVGRALSYGRTSAIGSVVGNAIGCYSACAVIAVGLGPLLERSDALFQTVKWAGVFYLLFLGIQAIRHAAPPDPGDIAGDSSETHKAQVHGLEKHRTETFGTAVRVGTVVGFTNPKGFVLFSAILPQFVEPEAGHTPLQMLVLGVVPVTIGLITDATWAVAAGSARAWFTRSPARMRVIGHTGGVCIIGVGISVAVSGTHR